MYNAGADMDYLKGPGFTATIFSAFILMVVFCGYIIVCMITKFASMCNNLVTCTHLHETL